MPGQELTDEEVGRRIREARLRAGFRSGATFAKAVGLTQPTLSRIESGKRPVTVTELARIAGRLNRAPQAFLEPGRGSDAFFRLASDADLSEGAERAVRWLERFAYRLQALRDFTPDTDLPRPVDVKHASPVSFEDAADIALRVRRDLGLGSAPAPDMVELLERVGCLVVVRKLGTEGPDAVYVPSPVATTLLNGDRPRVRQRFTCGHELGHHLFHGGFVTVDDDIHAPQGRAEQLCNVFAANFLMPRDGIDVELHRRFEVSRPERAEHAHWLAIHFGVSVEAMCYQLKNLGLISGQVAETWKQQNTRALASALGVLDYSQRPPVEQRWPLEFLDRLRAALKLRILDRAQLRRHLDNDRQAVQAVLA